ncbi:MAG TPA: class I poly(R)-hydroxyalkanoic acid synthase, partial [Burkholderiales bacterium]|nr:class I poly(R)-hydroxyalkanoic acid synthase [Burkholderiales bacterium]
MQAQFAYREPPVCDRDMLRVVLDPFGVARAALAVGRAWQAHPTSWLVPLLHYTRDMHLLGVQSALAACGLPSRPVIEPSSEDRRYADAGWRVWPYFSLLKQWSLLQARWTDEALRSNGRLPVRERRTLAFWTWQLQDACAPSNFLWTNPGAINACLRSNGESLVSGARLLAQDMCEGEVRMAPRRDLIVGRDLATTPGAVVYRNELIELIQYAPATAEVRETPVVVIPPWINKYYILDLTPEQSVLRHLVHAGYTVFAVSWKNPDAALAGASFEDYLMRGVREAVEVARRICGVPAVHAVGYCVGGTALATLMAWLNAGVADEPPPVAHWTLLSTLVDFSEPGPITAFVNEQSVDTICALMEQRGYLDGRQMALTFRMLRANSLIWHYVVRNYLYGEAPPSSPVLEWNMDTTRVPAAMHGWYLRHCYLENNLQR